jgi:hypothetical protein
LLFQQAVHAFQLLLLAQLDAVLRELGSLLAMLPRRIIAPFDGALIRVTTLSFQKEFEVFSSAKPANRLCISSQSFLPIKLAVALADGTRYGESELHL